MTFPSGILWCSFGSHDILGYVEMSLYDELAREGTVHQFVGPEQALGTSTQNKLEGRPAYGIATGSY